MLRNMMGWGGVVAGMMLKFLELGHRVDATQHIGVKTPQDFLKELQKILMI